MTKVYQYTQSNRLDAPHSYMYTPFEGEALLLAYRAARMVAIKKLSATQLVAQATDTDFDNCAVPFLEKSFDNISNEVGEKFRQISLSSSGELEPADSSVSIEILEGLIRQLANIDITKSVSTLDLLQSLVAAQSTGMADIRIKEWIDRLVQRFEVTKKLYVTYPPGFRKGAGATSSVKLYWLFALVLSLYYVSSNQIKYLSTLLKVCDLLCSLPEDLLLGHLSSNLMRAILATEVVSIELLVEKKGIDLAFT